MWDKTLAILQAAFDAMEAADQEALKQIGVEELAGLRASCTKTPWLAGAMMVMRSAIRPFDRSLFAVRPKQKAGQDTLGEFELMIHPAFFLMSWNARKQLNQALERMDPNEIGDWKKEFLNEAGNAAYKAEELYTRCWLAGILHEMGHVLHNPWMRRRPIERTAFAVLSQRFPKSKRAVRMDMAKAITELTFEGMAELRRAELEAWIRNSLNPGREIEPDSILSDTPLLFSMRDENRGKQQLPTPEELALIGLKENWSDLRMAEYIAQQITPPMMNNAAKNREFIQNLLKMIGATGNDETGGEKGKDQPAPENKKPSSKQIQQAIQGLVHIAQSMGSAKLIGTAPGGLQEVIQAVLEPPPPWHERLRMRLAAMGSRTGTPDLMPEEEYLYLMTGYKVWTPSFQMPVLGSLLFLADTSGSIADEMLQKAINQIQASVMNKDVGKVVLICWDTEMYPSFEAEGEAAVRQAMARVKITGRGGTDMCPVLEAAGEIIAKKGIQQVVTITDGMARYPANPPEWLNRIPMLFLTTVDRPPWGHPNLTVLKVEDLEPDWENA